MWRVEWNSSCERREYEIKGRTWIVKDFKRWADSGSRPTKRATEKPKAGNGKISSKRVKIAKVFELRINKKLHRIENKIQWIVEELVSTFKTDDGFSIIGP